MSGRQESTEKGNNGDSLFSKRMSRIFSQNVDLWMLLGFSLLEGHIINLAPSSPLMILGGAFFMFFAPGYALLAALCPSGKAILLGQRLAGSFGLSVVVVGVLSLIQTYWIGTTRSASYWITEAWIILMVLTAALRRNRTLASERHTARVRLASLFRAEVGKHRIGSILTLLLAGSLLLASAWQLLWASSRSYPQFTEFYLMDDTMMIAGIPQQVPGGVPFSVKIGIENHEGTPVAYELLYCVGGRSCDLITNIALHDDEYWENSVYVTPLDQAGPQKVDFVLYKADERIQYRILHLWIDVVEDSEG